MLDILLQAPPDFENWGAETGMGLGFTIFWFALFYVYPALCYHMIAKKTNTSPAWLAWIPIANVVLMLMIAEKPIWWIVLLFIPFVNIIWLFVFMVLVHMSMAERRGKPAWLGILAILGPVYFVIIGYLAFSE